MDVKIIFFVNSYLKRSFKHDLRIYFLILLHYMVERKKPNSLENIIKNLGYNMTKSRTRNTKYLITLGRNARGDAEPKVNEIIKLYSESKIPQLQTAENIIIDLIYNKKKKSITKRYDKLVDKYKTKEPLNKRLEQAKTIKPFIINVILYRLFRQGQDESDAEFKQRKMRTKLHKKRI